MFHQWLKELTRTEKYIGTSFQYFTILLLLDESIIDIRDSTGGKRGENHTCHHQQPSAYVGFTRRAWITHGYPTGVFNTCQIELPPFQ